MGQCSAWANTPGLSMSFGIKLLQQKWWVHGRHVCPGGTLWVNRALVTPEPSCWVASLHCILSYFLLWSQCIYSQVSHCTSQHRQGTKAVWGNRKAGVHLTHPKVSSSPSLLSIGLSGSRGVFPSQEYSWTSKGKATCCMGYPGLNEELSWNSGPAAQC